MILLLNSNVCVLLQGIGFVFQSYKRNQRIRQIAEFEEIIFVCKQDIKN